MSTKIIPTENTDKKPNPYPGIFGVSSSGGYAIFTVMVISTNP